MSKYPISHNGSKKLGEFFREILTFHVSPSKKRKILDPTCGKRYLWADFLKRDIDGARKLDGYGKVVFSDIVDYGQEVVSNVKDLKFHNRFDGIVYDPPYFFGCKRSSDPRSADYGGYSQTYADLLWFMDIGNERFPLWLKDDGKLILKCSDQYQVRERKFYSHHSMWISRLTNFRIVDTFIFIHHHISPTAFQVKNRPCSVTMHTYFLVFQKLD